jgi:hypothetical protein
VNAQIDTHTQNTFAQDLSDEQLRKFACEHKKLYQEVMQIVKRYSPDHPEVGVDRKRFSFGNKPETEALLLTVKHPAGNCHAVLHYVEDTGAAFDELKFYIELLPLHLLAADAKKEAHDLEPIFRLSIVRYVAEGLGTKNPIYKFRLLPKFAQNGLGPEDMKLLPIVSDLIKVYSDHFSNSS